jgi:glycosyltransferase involved in cell wall biosynthesis
MRIVFITNNYPPRVCGVGDYTYNLAHELHKAGHEVHVICSYNSEIRSIGYPKVYPIIQKMDYLNFLPAIAKINELKSDWVMVQYVPYSYSKRGTPLWLPAALKKIDRRQTKILLRIHEPYIRFAWWPAIFFITGQLQRLIIKRLSKVVDKMVTSIDLYKSFIDKYSFLPVDIIPIPSNILPVEADDKELNQMRGKVAPNGEKILSTFGIRNHALLVDVFRVVLKKHPASKLLVCGVVKDEKLYEPIREHVFVTGYLPGEEVFKYLKCSDVFFLPDDVTEKGTGGSSNKSTSLAAALAADLPVIGIKGDMNNELLKKAKTVYLEHAESDLIADRIIGIFSSETSTQESYLFWQEHFSWEKIIEKYDLVIRH